MSCISWSQKTWFQLAVQLSFLLQVELTSESDLFFHFTHTIGEEAFRQDMQQEQRLMVDYDQYPSMFVRLLNNCIQLPQAHIAVLLIEQSGHARLDFIQVCSVGQLLLLLL